MICERTRKVGQLYYSSSNYAELAAECPREEIFFSTEVLTLQKGISSGSGESAAVHFVQMDLLSFGDEVESSDNDPAVVRTVETLSVAGSDTPALVQEEEARTVGGTPSR